MPKQPVINLTNYTRVTQEMWDAAKYRMSVRADSRDMPFWEGDVVLIYHKNNKNWPAYSAKILALYWWNSADRYSTGYERPMPRVENIIPHYLVERPDGIQELVNHDRIPDYYGGGKADETLRQVIRRCEREIRDAQERIAAYQKGLQWYQEGLTGFFFKEARDGKKSKKPQVKKGN